MANLLLPLVPLLFIASFALADNLLQVSIDCGASGPYTDNNGIKWVTDDSYISTGDARTVQTAPDSLPVPYKTLRVFPSGMTKYCYLVAVKSGTQVRVQVNFNYGNYDGKSSPPSFELLIDGDDWDTIETRMDANVFDEGIYVVNGGSTSVCVAQNKPGQLPFVSAIQVWELGLKMYPHYDPTTALSLVERVAFGTPTTVRYPDDAYDRIWSPTNLTGSDLTVLKSDASSININATDQPPAAVLMAAVTPVDPAKVIKLNMGLGSDTYDVYVTMYFAETSKLSSGDKRSFVVFVDGNQAGDPIVPEYATAREYFLSGNGSGSTELALQATADSTLLPIINAMEVFIISDTRSNGTDATDVAGLESLVKQFDALNGWSGDPCLPQNYSWDWVKCSSDDTPRVTSIDLSGYGLSGKLPDFSSMDALETIDLHNNSISGAIPDSLGKMPSLKELNLADNSLSGPIPSSLSNNNKIKLVTTGNPNLCATGQSCKVISTPVSSPPGSRKSRSSSANKIIGSLGSFFGVVVTLSFFVIVF